MLFSRHRALLHDLRGPLLLASFPAIPFADSPPGSPLTQLAGRSGLRDGSRYRGTEARFLLDRFFVDENNPLLLEWTSDRLISPFQKASPIVLYGPAGSGKTTLGEIFARHYVTQAKVPWRIVRADQMAREYHAACATRTVENLVAQWAAPGFLMIDHLTLPVASPGLELLLVQLLDRLSKSGGVALITMPKPPFADDTAESALSSRLTGGVSIPVNFPGVAAKTAIAEHLLDRTGYRMADDELQDLVRQLPDAVPSLWGALQQRLPREPRTADKARGRDPDSPIARQRLALSDLQPTRGSERRCLSTEELRQIVSRVGRALDVPVSELAGTGRQRSRVAARNAVVWLGRSVSNTPFARIGQVLGKRDPSTMRHAFHSAIQQREIDWIYREVLDQLLEQLRNRFRCGTIAIPVEPAKSGSAQTAPSDPLTQSLPSSREGD